MTGDAGGPTGEAGARWPVALRGVTETIVGTLGPNDRWNQAALGVRAPGDRRSGDPDGTDSATATTWGATRTRRNFAERGGGYVQFVRDPLVFVEAALSVRESDDPVLEAADAWVRVEADRSASGREDGTEWVRWALTPVESAVVDERVPTTNRGFGAVVEATVAASRLDVPAYDRGDLLDRLAYFESVVERCGGRAEREAVDRLAELVDAEW